MRTPFLGAGAAYIVANFEIEDYPVRVHSKKAASAEQMQANFGMMIPKGNQREVATYVSASNIKR